MWLHLLPLQVMETGQLTVMWNTLNLDMAARVLASDISTALVRQLSKLVPEAIDFVAALCNCKSLCIALIEKLGRCTLSAAQ